MCDLEAEFVAFVSCSTLREWCYVLLEMSIKLCELDESHNHKTVAYCHAEVCQGCGLLQCVHVEVCATKS